MSRHGLALVAAAMMAGYAGPAEVACPGASAWDETHKGLLPAAMMSRDAARSLTRPELLAEIRRRADRDQQARRAWLENRSDHSLQGAVQAVDRDNIGWLRKLLGTTGLPTASEVGELGVHLTFILLQHAGSAPDLQQQALPVLTQRYQAGELPATDLARLVDRILVEQGKPQRFGTQFDWLSGKFPLPGAGRVAEIDANRRQLGLMPLSDYACRMNDWFRTSRWAGPPPEG